MPVQILIEQTDDGKVNVGGPLQNKVLMYGLLEIAKEVVKSFAEQNERRVQPASLMPQLPPDFNRQ